MNYLIIKNKFWSSNEVSAWIEYFPIINGVMKQLRRKISERLPMAIIDPSQFNFKLMAHTMLAKINHKPKQPLIIIIIPLTKIQNSIKVATTHPIHEHS
jgi:hypothetical protein